MVPRTGAVGLAAAKPGERHRECDLRVQIAWDVSSRLGQDTCIYTCKYKSDIPTAMIDMNEKNLLPMAPSARPWQKALRVKNRRFLMVWLVYYLHYNNWIQEMYHVPITVSRTNTLFSYRYYSFKKYTFFSIMQILLLILSWNFIKCNFCNWKEMKKKKIIWWEELIFATMLHKKNYKFY